MNLANQANGPRAYPLAKFIQICASQNDLFALDEEGSVHQYDFNAKTWGKLAVSRSPEGPACGDPRARGAEWARSS